MKATFTINENRVDGKETRYDVESYFDHACYALINLYKTNRQTRVYVDLKDYFKIPGNPSTQGTLFLEYEKTKFGFDAITAIGVSNSSGGLFRVYLDKVH